MSDEKINSLTKEQEDQIPVYLKRYEEIGLSTRPTDRVKAEAAITAAYTALGMAVPELVWRASPYAGAILAAQLHKGSMDVSKEEIADQATKASYGSFEAYWVSFYAYIGEQLPVEVDKMLRIVQDIVDECGVYWTFEDIVVLTDKPTKICMKDDMAHSEDGKAIEYSDGSGLYAYRGVRYASLTEIKLNAIIKDET